MSMFGWLRRRPSDVKELLAKVGEARNSIPRHLRHLSDELVADLLRAIKGWSAEDVETYRATVRGGATPDSFVHQVLVHRVLDEIRDGGNEVYPGIPNPRGASLRELHRVLAKYGVERGFMSIEDVAHQRLGISPGAKGASDAAREQRYAENVEEWIASHGNQGNVDWSQTLVSLRAMHDGVAEELRALCVAGWHARRDVAEVGMICIDIAQACRGGGQYDMDWIRGRIDDVLEGADIQMRREHLIVSAVMRFAPAMLRAIHAGSCAEREIAELWKDGPQTSADERLYMVFGDGFERLRDIALTSSDLALDGSIALANVERIMRGKIRAVLEVVYDDWRQLFEEEVHRFASLVDVPVIGNEASAEQDTAGEAAEVEQQDAVDAFRLRVDHAIQSYCESSGLSYMDQIRALRQVDEEFACAEEDVRSIGAALAVADNARWSSGSIVAYFVVTSVGMRKDGRQAANQYLNGVCRTMQKKLRAHFSDMGKCIPANGFACNVVTISSAFGEAFKDAVLLAVGCGCDGRDVGSALNEVERAMEREGYLDSVWRDAAYACCRFGHELGVEVRHGRMSEESAFGAAAEHLVELFVRAMFEFERRKKV